MFTYGWRGREVPGRRSNTQQHPPHGDHQICGVATGPPTVALTSTAAEMLGLRETWKHPPSPMSECSATVAVPGVLAGVCVWGGTPTCPSPTHHRAPPWEEAQPPWPWPLAAVSQEMAARQRRQDGTPCPPRSPLVPEVSPEAHRSWPASPHTYGGAPSLPIRPEPAPLATL